MILLCLTVVAYICPSKEKSVMVEDETEDISRLLLSMASSSSNVNTTTLQYKQYPPPLANYEDVLANPKLFMDCLGKLHANMGTKFMIPVIGGRDLDLHRAFVEVTSRGGIERVLREKKWKEVTGVFNFPSSATNASFILRKYYYSLLHHFEQIYFFKAKMWTPVSSDGTTASTVKTSSHGLDHELRSRPSSENQAAEAKLENMQRTEPLHGALPTRTAVTGVIDGKFDGGYLVTVTLGSEKLKGVIYHFPADTNPEIQENHEGVGGAAVAAPAPPRPQRRRRRKKSEIKKRDPSHPKPNRSGYNFFFAEQHARLKPLHPGRDRDISRMIGELWNNLNMDEKSVYQGKAMEDKERYRLEMEVFKQKPKKDESVSNDDMPIHQQPAVNVNEPGKNIEAALRDYTHLPENDMSSGKTDRSISGNDKDSDTEAVNMAEFEMENVGPSNLGNEIETINECPMKKQKCGNEGESVEEGS